MNETLVEVFWLIGTFAVIVIVFASLWSSAYAEPQLATDPDYEGCEIIQFHDNFELPFRIEMTHEPATRQAVSDDHNDPASRLVFDRTEVVQTDAQTHLAFSSNSTDDWIIRVDLEYKSEKTEPREVLVLMQTANEQFLEKRIYHEGFDFCIVYDLWARPAQPILSTAEVLQLADKISEDNMDSLVRTVDEGNTAVTRATDTNSVIALVMILFIISTLVATFTIRRSEKQLKKEMLIQKNSVKNERIKLETACEHVGFMQRNINAFIEQSEMKINTLFLHIKKEIPGGRKTDIEKPYEFEQEPVRKEPVIEKTEQKKTTMDKVTMGISGLGKKFKIITGKSDEQVDLAVWKEQFKKETNGDMEKLGELYKKYNGMWDADNPDMELKDKINALYQLIITGGK